MPGRVPCSCLAAVNERSAPTDIGGVESALGMGYVGDPASCWRGGWDSLNMGIKKFFMLLLEAAAGSCWAPGSIFRFCKRRAGVSSFPAAFWSSSALPRSTARSVLRAPGVCLTPCTHLHPRFISRSSRSLVPNPRVIAGGPPAPRRKRTLSWTTRRCAGRAASEPPYLPQHGGAVPAGDKHQPLVPGAAAGRVLGSPQHLASEGHLLQSSRFSEAGV